MSKQTAIDWLIEEIAIPEMLHTRGKIDYSHMVKRKNEIIAKAKEMEREQIIDAYDDALGVGRGGVKKEYAEQYYTKKYGGNNEQ